MLLQVKTLSNEKFTVECELYDVVRTIKEKIANHQDFKDRYDVDAMKLIFSGKILEDAKTLDSYSINKDSFIVVVKQTVPKTGQRKYCNFTATPTRTVPTATNNPGTAAATASTASLFTPTPVPPVGASSQDAFTSNEAREKAITELTEMGFERAKAEQALRASFYHVERAAEYLLTGNIPDTREPVPPSLQTQSSGQGQGGQARRQPNDELADLNSSPQFQALRNLIQQNPDQLQTLMQTLQQTQPELFQLIEQRPQEFLELLNQVDPEGDDDSEHHGTGGEPGGPGAGPVTITLSPQDQAAINRLQDMGFERNRVIEAFLACDRNEEMAANYLLSDFN
ncbi:unnamed protein product [Didymodactylos carnosus]|uniref:UV excision repair protein RAD23 n=1 Tax=Didymodactylos carnosus TaxID=1234261 RepID=A0A814IY48_9BILA|nr:unnamed protein product [Didymodactylos carnosus]CAF1032035.1 unnamed protein product [Didymodactylos carnosus]CAF3540499.1 unnamed protein product [Didymodactylos carnosus]CAF3802803.1 unnamed protein product [Didymodactylos carnosus]